MSDFRDPEGYRFFAEPVQQPPALPDSHEPQPAPAWASPDDPRRTTYNPEDTASGYPDTSAENLETSRADTPTSIGRTGLEGVAASPSQSDSPLTKQPDAKDPLPAGSTDVAQQAKAGSEPAGESETHGEALVRRMMDELRAALASRDSADIGTWRKQYGTPGGTDQPERAAHDEEPGARRVYRTGGKRAPLDHIGRERPDGAEPVTGQADTGADRPSDRPRRAARIRRAEPGERVPGISGIEEITPPRDRPSRLNIRRIEPAGENAEPSRFELKNDFLVPLHFSCTSNLTGSERNAALLGIRDALVASGQDRRIVVTNPAVLEQNPHLTADAHIQAALRRQPIDRDLGFGKQVDLQGVLNALHQTETQRPPQWNIMVVDHDLTAPVGNGEYLNFAFGVTVPTEHVSVQSVTRLMEAIPPGELRDAAIRRVLRHETGHLFGLPSYRRESNPRGNVEENLGLHCTNPCTMRQGLSVPAWVNLTVQEHNAGIHFCSDCQNDLARVRDTYKPLPRR